MVQHYRVGVEISDASQLKLGRARELFEEAAQLIEDWADAADFEILISKSDGGRSCDIRTVVGSFPDCSHLQMLTGDILHNLRSAHENLLYGIFQFHNSGKKVPRWLKFPYSTAPQDWLRQRSQLAQLMPRKTLDRIRRIQPYTDRPDGILTSSTYIKSAALRSIALLNNDDKHKDSHRCRVERHEYGSRSPIRFGGDADMLSVHRADPAEYLDGSEPSLRATQSDPDGKIVAWPIAYGLRVALVDANGVSEPYLSSLEILIAQAVFNLSFVGLGENGAQRIPLRFQDRPFDVTSVNLDGNPEPCIAADSDSFGAGMDDLPPWRPHRHLAPEYRGAFGTGRFSQY
ncbi:MAG TPA: hypothetical protein VFC82_10340 [Actinomycetaceae bacterium]|nr:hypothetical protein [Actinomycetaceae bacterium]